MLIAIVLSLFPTFLSGYFFFFNSIGMHPNENCCWFA